MTASDPRQKPVSIDTLLQHLRPLEEPGGPSVAPPIYQTVNYAPPDPEVAATVARAHHPQRFYTRYGSPTLAVIEEAMRALEGAEAALAVGSGMAAISATLAAHVRSGDHVVAQQTHYTGALSFLTDWLPRQGVAVTHIDQTDLGALRAALRPETKLVYVESPTNPTMALTDLAAVAEIARGHGALSVTDNTFASSYNQRPHDLGIDLVAQSATKYLNGHGDATAGVITGSKALVDPIWEYARVHGPVLHPMEAWLLARGLKTYSLRMPRHNSNAQAVAEALAETEGVVAAHYPGLPSHPQHALAKAQMPGGFSGMLSFELAARDAAERHARAAAALGALTICVSAASLGTTETLVTHPASMIFHQAPEAIEAAGISTGLLRVSVGLEDPADLIDDLRAAIAAALRV